MNANTGAGSNYAAAFLGGNVGVGTSSPSQQLSVQGNTLISGNLTVANITATGTVTYSGLGANMLASINNAGNLVSTSTPTAAYYLATSSTASILPYASTTALTVSGAGGLYLGTITGPLQSIAGAVSASSTLSTFYGGTGANSFTSNGILYGNGGGTLQVTAQGGTNTVLTANSGAPSFSSTPTLTSLTLSGLGTSMLLTSNASGVITASSTPTAAYYLATSSIASIFPYATTTSISSSQGAWFATSGGSVGIGTTSPGATFSVQGNGLFSNNLAIAGLTATGTIAFNQAARASGITPYFTLTGGADTGLTASTEAPDIQFNLARTKTHANNTITLQRDFLLNAATHAFTNWGAGLITDLATFGITGAPLVGTNATSTNAHTLYLSDSALNASTTNS